MSKQIVCTAAASSSTSPPLIRIPCAAPTPPPTITAVGVARPRAHGQAITSTAHPNMKASSWGSSTRGMPMLMAPCPPPPLPLPLPMLLPAWGSGGMLWLAWGSGGMLGELGGMLWPAWGLGGEGEEKLIMSRSSSPDQSGMLPVAPAMAHAAHVKIASVITTGTNTAEIRSATA